MQWYVYYHNVNEQKIETYNIFDHRGFNQDIKRGFKKCDTKKEFADEVRFSLQYYFWTKSEWEIVISPWGGDLNTKNIKIDAYNQVMNNWKAFIDYVWSFRSTK